MIVTQPKKEPEIDSYTTGYILRVDSRAYGFIVEQQSLSSIFFHMSDCLSDFAQLKAGQVVCFKTIKQDGRFRAVNVQRLFGVRGEKP